jgi:hypothetical protein
MPIYRLKKETPVLIILAVLADVGRHPAHDFAPRALGDAAGKGWVNIVDGWASLSALGRATHLSNIEAAPGCSTDFEELSRSLRSSQ